VTCTFLAAISQSVQLYTKFMRNKKAESSYFDGRRNQDKPEVNLPLVENGTKLFIVSRNKEKLEDVVE